MLKKNKEQNFLLKVWDLSNPFRGLYLSRWVGRETKARTVNRELKLKPLISWDIIILMNSSLTLLCSSTLLSGYNFPIILILPRLVFMTCFKAVESLCYL